MGRKKIPIVNVDNGRRFESAYDAALELGIDHSTIVNQLRGRYKTAGGFRFQYEHLLPARHSTGETNECTKSGSSSRSSRVSRSATMAEFVILDVT